MPMAAKAPARTTTAAAAIAARLRRVGLGRRAAPEAPRNPPLACGPVPSSPGLGPVGLGFGAGLPTVVAPRAASPAAEPRLSAGPSLLAAPAAVAASAVAARAAPLTSSP